MNHKVGSKPTKVLHVIQSGLRHDPGDPLQVFDDGAALPKGHIRKALVAGNRLIRQDPDDDLPVPCRRMNDVEMSRMDDIGTHGNVNYRVISGRFGFWHLKAHPYDYLGNR